MMISTKGRYALRVMIDIAEHSDGGYIAMKEIAARQGVSLKYVERILPVLVSAGLIEGVHGKGGGYRLTRNPDEYPVGEILRLTEGDLAPVTCLGAGAPPCAMAPECRTIALWRDLGRVVNDYLNGVSLASLMRKKTPSARS